VAPSNDGIPDGGTGRDSDVVVAIKNDGESELLETVPDPEFIVASKEGIGVDGDKPIGGGEIEGILGNLGNSGNSGISGGEEGSTGGMVDIDGITGGVGGIGGTGGVGGSGVVGGAVELVKLFPKVGAEIY
jgi:hypothetical protein